MRPAHRTPQATGAHRTRIVLVLVLATFTLVSLGSVGIANASNHAATPVQSTSLPQSTPSFDFSLSSPGGISISGISSGSTTLIVRLVGGPTQPITLSCTTELPPDSACIFTPSSNSPSFNSTFTITIRSTTPIGTYPVTVTGTGGGQTHTTTVTLTIFYPPPSGVIGGNLIPLNFVTLLTPFALIATAAVTAILYLERRTRKAKQ